MAISPSPVSDQARLAALYEVSRTLGASLNLTKRSSPSWTPPSA
jgi:hypothetical protein